MELQRFVGKDTKSVLDEIRAALAAFGGVNRRFTRVGVVDGVTIIDDYGHHPTEIAAVEIRPGNSAVDHHALIGYTDNPSVIAQAQSMDAADPNPGYESFGDYGVDVEQFLFGGWVPGTPPLEFPPTIGHLAEPWSHLLLQMHF